MFHCPVGVWVIEQHAIILSATVRSPTVTLSVERPYKHIRKLTPDAEKRDKLMGL